MLAHAWDTKYKSGSEKSSRYLMMHEEDIIEWQKSALQEEITLRLMDKDLVNMEK